MELVDLAGILKALSDPTRLRLVQLLGRQEERPGLCVNALAQRLGVSQPAVSQHLRVLRNLGLVRGERRGYRVHYGLVRGRLRECKEEIASLLEGATGKP